MQLSHAFQPGGLDRAAQLRTADTTRSEPAARTFVFWRGKLLVGADNQPLLVTLDHAALADCREPPLFIGMTPDGPRFAADLVHYTPHEDAATIGQFTDQTAQMHPGFPDGKLVADVFGMTSEVVPDPVSGTPMVVPRGRHHNAA